MKNRKYRKRKNRENRQKEKIPENRKDQKEGIFEQIKKLKIKNRKIEKNKQSK